jgi:hypothetical protein
VDLTEGGSLRSFATRFRSLLVIVLTFDLLLRELRVSFELLKNVTAAEFIANINRRYVRSAWF